MSDKDSNQPQKRICIARIAAPHGVKGLVKILPFCEDLSLIDTITDFDITLKNQSGKYILAEIAGINSREDVQSIQGTDLYIDRDELPDIDEGEYYIEDLVGLPALNQSGKNAGTVIAVHNFGAGDLLEIKPNSGDTYLLPFTDDHVPEITNDHITVIPMEAIE